MRLDRISAVLVTRGDVDLKLVLDRLPFEDVVIWDNSKQEVDSKVYGRYLGMALVKNDVVYVQDDDCLLEPGAIEHLAEMYKPGEITCNMPISRWPDYPDSCLVGWGSVFDRELPGSAFYRWHHFWAGAAHPTWDEFAKCCDVVFTTLTPHTKLDLGFTHLPWAETPGRMFKQPDHQPMRARMLDQARLVRDAT